MGAGLDLRFEIISATRFQEAQFFSRFSSFEDMWLFTMFCADNFDEQTLSAINSVWKLSEENRFHKSYLKLMNNLTVQVLSCLPRLRQQNQYFKVVLNPKRGLTLISAKNTFQD